MGLAPLAMFYETRSGRRGVRGEARGGEGRWRGLLPLLLLLLLLLPHADGFPPGTGTGSGHSTGTGVMSSGASVATGPSAAGPSVAGPSFPRQPRVVLAPVGGDAVLKCQVLNLGDKAVSWVRSRDLVILSHAGVAFTSDARVSASGTRDATTATSTQALRVRDARLSDAGRYECQLNTEPKMSLFFDLAVVDAIDEPEVMQHDEWSLPSHTPAPSPRAPARARVSASTSTSTSHAASTRVATLTLTLLLLLPFT